MNKLKELSRVEETKHLLPNLPILVKALFPEYSYLVDWRHSHGDWATMRLKYGDGMVWLPWHGQLWLIEIEWKEGSNFFEQSRAFARGKIDSEQLSRELKKRFHEFESILNKASPDMKEGHVVDNIVTMAMKNHISRGSYLKPHGWVILGHDGHNIDKLREDYERELKARFRNDQQYILSMARLFYNDYSTYILLEQYCSKRCQELFDVERSILIPSIPVSAELRPTKLRKVKRTKRKESVESEKEIGDQCVAKIPPSFFKWKALSVGKLGAEKFPRDGKFTIHFKGYGNVSAYMSQNRVKIPAPEWHELTDALKIKANDEFTIAIKEELSYYEASKIAKDEVDD